MAEEESNYKALYKEHRQKYKVLKKAATDEMMARVELEKQCEDLRTRLEEQSAELNEMKARNLQLQEQTEQLQDVTGAQKTFVNQAKKAVQNHKADEHLKELLEVQKLLKEEMRQKEALKQKELDTKQQAAEEIEELLQENVRVSQQAKQDKTRLDDMRADLSHYENKNKKLLQDLDEHKQYKIKKDAECASLKTWHQDKDEEMEKLRKELDWFKEQNENKEEEIKQLLKKLFQRGEEAGFLQEQLMSLKNHMLDQSVFEMVYLATRVPLEAISGQSQSDLVKQSPKLQRQVLRKEMLVTFVRDTAKIGEYFMKLASSEQSEDEAKIVPILDIAKIEVTPDKLGLTIFLESEADPESYSENSQPKLKQKSEKGRTSSFFSKIFNKQASGDQDAWPMSFESEHVGKIYESFRKVQEYAMDKYNEIEAGMQMRSGEVGQHASPGGSLDSTEHSSQP